MKVELYRDAANEWRWRIVASNGRIVADCGEGYEHHNDAYREVLAVTGDRLPVLTK